MSGIPFILVGLFAVALLGASYAAAHTASTDAEKACFKQCCDGLGGAFIYVNYQCEYGGDPNAFDDCTAGCLPPETTPTAAPAPTACTSNLDCASGYCNSGTCGSAPAPGGTAVNTCAPYCANGKSCTSNGDCAFNNCTAGICQSVTTDSSTSSSCLSPFILVALAGLAFVSNRKD